MFRRACSAANWRFNSNTALTLLARVPPILLNGRTESAQLGTISNLATKRRDQNLSGGGPAVRRGGVGNNNFQRRRLSNARHHKSIHLTKRRMQLVGATALLLLVPHRRPRPGARPAARRSFRHALLRHRARARWPVDRYPRHRRQHPRPAQSGSAAAGPALDQRAATQPGHRRRNRPGVRRRVRRCHSPEHLRHRHRGVRPAPDHRQCAVDARHVRPWRSRRDLQARCRERLQAGAVLGDPAERSAEHRRRARQHRV